MFQMAATPPRPATPEAVTSREPSAVKWTAVTLPGKSSSTRAGRSSARVPSVAVRWSSTAAYRADGQPLAVARGVEGGHGPEPANARRSWGPSGRGGRPARRAAPGARVDPRLDQRDVLLASGRGSPFGGMAGFAAPVNWRMIRLSAGVARREHGAVRRALSQRGVALERELALAIARRCDSRRSTSGRSGATCDA